MLRFVFAACVFGVALSSCVMGPAYPPAAAPPPPYSYVHPYPYGAFFEPGQPYVPYLAGPEREGEEREFHEHAEERLEHESPQEEQHETPQQEQQEEQQEHEHGQR